jgi:hypothetical protein
MTLQTVPPMVTPQIEPIFAPVPLQRPIFMKELLTISSGTVIPGNPPYKLNGTVIATIDYTGDGVVIASPMLDEEGYGETYEAAWYDFLVSLRDRYASLAKRESNLSPGDREVLDNLRSLLAS